MRFSSTEAAFSRIDAWLLGALHRVDLLNRDSRYSPKQAYRISRRVNTSSPDAGAGGGNAAAARYDFQLLPYWKPSQESSFPDEIAWVDERSFVVVGRRDSVVQAGGFNVQPLEGFAHTPQNRKRVETWIVENLKPIECPKAIRFGDKLPRNEMGKLCNWDWVADEEPEPVFA